MPFKKSINNKGIALILSIMLVTLVLFLSLYYLSFSLSEKKISLSQTTGERTYYLAESGIADMIWKLKNDPVYNTAFQTNPAWSASFTRTDPFGANSGSYTVSIANSGTSYGDIISTGLVTLNGKTSQRVIKTRVYRLVGVSGMGTNAIMNGTSTLYVHNSDYVEISGDVNSNGAIKANGNSEFEISGNLSTASDIQDNGSIVVSGSSTSYASPQLVPGVNFMDLLNSATTKLANDAAMDATGTISGITWASTTVDIERDMIINGLLVVNGNLTIKNSSDITVNYASGSPSGIMVNGNLTISDTSQYKGNIDINGILYATGKIYVNKLFGSNHFNLNGGIASGNGLEIDNCAGDIRIIFNNDILVDSLKSTSTSPVIAIDHWEEEY